MIREALVLMKTFKARVSNCVSDAKNLLLRLILRGAKWVKKRPILTLVIATVLFTLRLDPLLVLFWFGEMFKEIIIGQWPFSPDSTFDVLMAIVGAFLVGYFNHIALRVRHGFVQEIFRLIINMVGAIVLAMCINHPEAWAKVLASAFALSFGQYPVWSRVRKIVRTVYEPHFRRKAAQVFAAHKKPLCVAVIHYEPLAFSQSLVPSGPFPNQLMKMFEGMALSIEWRQQESLANLLAALENGEVDVLLPALTTSVRCSKSSVDFIESSPIEVFASGLTLSEDHRFHNDEGSLLKVKRILKASSWEEILEMDDVRFVVNAREVGDEIVSARLGGEGAYRIRRNENSDLFSVLGPLIVGEGDIIVADAITLVHVQERAIKKGYNVKKVLWDQPLGRFPCTVAMSTKLPQEVRQWFTSEWERICWRLVAEESVQNLKDKGAINIMA